MGDLVVRNGVIPTHMRNILNEVDTWFQIRDHPYAYGDHFFSRFLLFELLRIISTCMGNIAA